MSFGRSFMVVCSSSAADCQKLLVRYHSTSARCASTSPGLAATVAMSLCNSGLSVGGGGGGSGVLVGTGVIEMPATPLPSTGAPVNCLGERTTLYIVAPVIPSGV